MFAGGVGSVRDEEDPFPPPGRCGKGADLRCRLLVLLQLLTDDVRCQDALGLDLLSIFILLLLLSSSLSVLSLLLSVVVVVVVVVVSLL